LFTVFASRRRWCRSTGPECSRALRLDCSVIDGAYTVCLIRLALLRRQFVQARYCMCCYLIYHYVIASEPTFDSGETMPPRKLRLRRDLACKVTVFPRKRCSLRIERRAMGNHT